MRRIAVALTVSTVVLAGAVGAAWAVTPANGVYGGITNGAPNREGEGYFRTRGTAATKRIVPAGTFSCNGGSCYQDKIVAPSNFACNQLNAKLEVAKIPVSAGAFDYTGKADIGTAMARMNIRFKGTWQTSTTVTGFTRIWNPSCDSGKVRWTMTSPPSP